MRTKLAFFALLSGMLASTGCSPEISTSTGFSAAQPALPGSNAIPRPAPTILRQRDLGPKPHGWLNAGSRTGSLIYVAAGNQVLIFPESGYNRQQIGAITDGISSAYGLYVDGSRNLYVANAGTITAYHPGSLSPYVVYKDPADPLYIVKNHSGWLYAANRNGSVTEYLPGHTTPSRTLRTPGTEADGINVDDAGNVYVAYRDSSGIGSIKKFQANSRNGHILGMQLTQPQGLQLDHSGNILVVETGGKQVVDIFPPDSTSPSKVVQATDGVTQVVLRNANENMYVSNFLNNNVYISPYPPGEFQQKLQASGGGRVQGMALSNEEP
jgi:hypothetical protein